MIFEHSNGQKTLQKIGWLALMGGGGGTSHDRTYTKKLESKNISKQ